MFINFHFPMKKASGKFYLKKFIFIMKIIFNINKQQRNDLTSIYLQEIQYAKIALQVKMTYYIL